MCACGQPVTLAPRDELAASKERLLSAGNLSAPFQLSVRALRSDSDLLVAMRIIAATPTELRRYADAFRGAALSPRNEVKWRLLLRETVEALLADAEAETSAAQDELLLARWAGERSQRPLARAGGGQAERRHRAALTCRLGEKRLLRAVLEDLSQSLAELRKPQGAADSPTRA